MSIFIVTDDPVSVFERTRLILAENQILDTAKGASRRIESDDHTLLWPSDAKAFDVV